MQQVNEEIKAKLIHVMLNIAHLTKIWYNEMWKVLSYHQKIFHSNFFHSFSLFTASGMMHHFILILMQSSIFLLPLSSYYYYSFIFIAMLDVRKMKSFRKSDGMKRLLAWELSCYSNLFKLLSVFHTFILSQFMCSLMLVSTVSFV